MRSFSSTMLSFKCLIQCFDWVPLHRYFRNLKLELRVRWQTTLRARGLHSCHIRDYSNEIVPQKPYETQFFRETGSMESYPAGLWRSNWSGFTSTSKALTGTDENVGQRRKDTRANSDQTHSRSECCSNCCHGIVVWGNVFSESKCRKLHWPFTGWKNLSQSINKWNWTMMCTKRWASSYQLIWLFLLHCYVVARVSLEGSRLLLGCH